MKLGFVAPVAVEGFDGDVVVLLPLDELERASTNRVLVDALAELLERFHRDDETGRDRQIGQQRRKLAVEREFDVEVADSFHLRHDIRDVVADEWEAAVVTLGILVQRIVFVDFAIEGERDRLSIERRAVVEFHAGLQMEDVLGAVGRDIPLLGQGWLHVGAARLVAHQAFVDRGGGDEALLRVHRRRVEAIGIASEQKRQRVRRGGRGLGGWRRRCRGRWCGSGRGGGRGRWRRGWGGGRLRSGGRGGRRGSRCCWAAGGQEAHTGGQAGQTQELAAAERGRKHL